MSDLNMLEQINQKACIIAVRNAIDHDLRDFTLEAANRAYLESVGRLDEIFVPGRSYTYYIKDNPNFETFCLNASPRRKHSISISMRSFTMRGLICMQFL